MSAKKQHTYICGRAGISYIPIITAFARNASPGSNSNIRLPIRERTDEFLKLGMVFDSVDSHNITFAVEMDAIFQTVLGSLACFIPCFVEVLHELGVALAGRCVADLLDGKVTSCADDVAQIEEVVALIFY